MNRPETYLTPKGYIAMNGEMCPYCMTAEPGNIQIENGAKITSLGDGIGISLHCLSCGTKWYEEYILMGFRYREGGDDNA